MEITKMSRLRIQQIGSNQLIFRNVGSSIFVTFGLCIMFTLFSSCMTSDIVRHYNIPDPDCTGPFGLCTQHDKDRLGFLAIKKLHENMDDDRDGHVEIHETKEFMTEELQYKNGAHSERQQKFHGSDSSISVEEMWKSWQYSQVYNWTTDDLIVWLNEQVKLPKYGDYFRRNQIDGQFLPRLALNENNYYSNVLQIKDARHRKQLMIKATDLVLFGLTQKPHNLIKDILMISLLTLSIFSCIYLYSKHRQSLEQIKQMMIELDKLNTADDALSDSNNNNGSLGLQATVKRNSGSTALTPTEVVNNGSNLANGDLISNTASAIAHSVSTSSLFSMRNRNKNEGKSHGGIFSLTQRLLKEPSVESADNKKSTIIEENENDLRADGQINQLKLTELELEKVKIELKQARTRLESTKYQPPVQLLYLLNRTYESEKELLEYKFKIIDKEKESCLDCLNKVSKRQSGILGALKIAHSSTLEEVNHKLEILKREIVKCKAEKHEWIKRWNNIEELCIKQPDGHQNFFESNSDSQEQQSFISLENGLILPRKLWHLHPSNNTSNNSGNNNNNSNAKYSTISNLIIPKGVNANPLFTLNDESNKIHKSLTFTANPSTNNNNNQLHNSVTNQQLANSKSQQHNNQLQKQPTPPSPTIQPSAQVSIIHNNNIPSITLTNIITSQASKMTKNNSKAELADIYYDQKHKLITSQNGAKSGEVILNGSSNSTDNQNGYSDDYDDVNTDDSKRNSLGNIATVKIQTSNQNQIASIRNYSGNSFSVASNTMPKTPPTTYTTTITNSTQKIARDSMIHKNDVFQFDDVDSVQTNDLFFKKTPQSSFESDNTYKSSSLARSPNNQSNGNGKKLLAAKKSLANFITPIFRSSSGSNNQSSGQQNGFAKKTLRPLSTSSIASNLSSKVKKSKTDVILVNGEGNGIINNNNINGEFTKKCDTPSVGSLERSSTFKKKLNSFRNLINPYKGNKNNDSSTNLPTIKTSLENVNDTINNLHVNNSPNNHLTVSLNSNNVKNLNTSSSFDNSHNASKLSSSSIAEVISIPVCSASTASFTITNQSNEQKEDIESRSFVITDSSNNNGLVNSANDNNSKLNKVKSKSKLFKFKLNKSSAKNK